MTTQDKRINGASGSVQRNKTEGQQRTSRQVAQRQDTRPSNARKGAAAAKPLSNGSADSHGARSQEVSRTSDKAGFRLARKAYYFRRGKRNRQNLTMFSMATMRF